MANHSIVHVEIPAKDPATSGKFYADLFGWNIQVEESFNYYMFQPESGPGGAFPLVGGDAQYKPGEVIVYVSTDDIDATLAKAESLGAKTLLPKTEIPYTGWFAFFADPAGNRIALYTVLSQAS